MTRMTRVSACIHFLILCSGTHLLLVYARGAASALTDQDNPAATDTAHDIQPENVEQTGDNSVIPDTDVATSAGMLMRKGSYLIYPGMSGAMTVMWQTTGTPKNAAIT